MPGPMFLEGEDVALHTVESEDLDFLQEHINDPAVRSHLTVTTPTNRDQEETWFEEQVTGDEHINLLVMGPDGPSGSVGLGPVNDPDGSAEIGLWIREADWGKGYGTEASRLLVGHAFDELRIHRIIAQVFEGNEASKRLWEKLGFRHESVHREAAYLGGEYVDLHRFAILEQEWRDDGA